MATRSVIIGYGGNPEAAKRRELDGFLRTLEWLNRATRDNAGAALVAATSEVNEGIKRDTPVITGTLKAGFAVESGPVKATSVTAYIVNYVHYAGYVEFGTWKMDPRAMVRKNLIKFAGYFKDLVRQTGIGSTLERLSFGIRLTPETMTATKGISRYEDNVRRSQL